MLRVLYDRRGQGLLEGIVAVGVLVTGLVSIVALSNSNLQGSEQSASRIVALNLTREGIEAVRVVRDGNWLAGRTAPSGSGPSAWDSGLAGGATDVDAIPVLGGDGSSRIDFTPAGFADAATLIYRDAAGIFRQDVNLPTGTRTTMRRLLSVYPVCRDVVARVEVSTGAVCQGSYVKVGLRVVATVTWFVGGSSRNLNLESFVYNWRFAPAP